MLFVMQLCELSARSPLSKLHEVMCTLIARESVSVITAAYTLAGEQGVCTSECM